LLQVLPDVSEAEVVRVFSALDVDHTGSVDVHEFFAGLLHTMDQEMQSALAAKSFSALDT
jgi:calcium-dependent protein kinase